MKKMTAIICLLSFILITTHCAFVFKGERRDIRFNSEPEGARVFINGEFYGRTPVKLELEPEESYVIEFRREGYEPVTRQLTNHVGVGWVILDVVTGLVPVLVDALTGAWYEFDQTYLNVILERQKELSSVLFPAAVPAL